MTKEQIDAFTEASKPLVKLINDNPTICNPQTIAIVENDRAELLSGECMVKIDEFIKD